YMKLDEKDLRILNILKKNAELNTSQISKKTGIPITTIHNRIKKLKQEGIIKNYTINIDHEKIGKPLASYILITINQSILGKKISQHEIGRRLKAFDEVESADIVTGATDIIIKVRAESMKGLNEFITEKLRNIEGIDKTQTLMVLEEI
ncbi:Lrp/AsnC family transcriptional regulator, partial [Candidatus Woesearchaeota archaeon]|nr:Lrp/AsnC family transcriptional regulator [Candidatus Woesearchaeota archaeon]